MAIRATGQLFLDRLLFNSASKKSLNLDTKFSSSKWLNVFSVDFEFLTVVAERKVKMWTGIKYGLIQYLAFFFGTSLAGFEIIGSHN